MTITAALVKELRERTGLGMMDCKRALQETDGDVEQAIDDLRKKSALKAAKKAGRTTANGLLGVKISDDNSTTQPMVRSGPTMSAMSSAVMAFWIPTIRPSSVK